MTAPDLRPAFPHTEPLTVNGLQTLCDRDFQPSCGYVSLDEAAILYQVARDFPGTWCEIGSHTGWSAAHIARGLIEVATHQSVVAVEPQYVYLDFFTRARNNWHGAGIDHVIYPVAANSWDYFKGCRETFTGAHIDGDHEQGKPLQDAQDLLPHMADRSVVCLHDFVGAPIREAVTFLRAEGFRYHVYDTMAMMAVCWRGDDQWRSPSHVAEDSRDWHAHRLQFTDFDWRDEQ